ncbi:hypothetical protein CYMTET_28311 [Cymbomonas tetramitiformis]|uniref:Uncharacterized protein n=1 Tax=Cymbomonas tetramitiformis TaxID=36881 RepID=A0AAE0FN70_9CHLO|nr:hypothetical protein CYMTET_28311 [Cymbomonas tetramitiformis]|eukprot:gene27499-33918_t
MSAYDRIKGGKLTFKGSAISKDKKKKKKKVKVDEEEGGELVSAAAAAAPAEETAGEEARADGEEEEDTNDGTVLIHGSTIHRVKKKEGDHGIDHTNPGQTYETIFHYETQRMKDAKGRSLCFGTNYREAPEILHGYTRKVKGKTSEERLDKRCAQKADKYCR